MSCPFPGMDPYIERPEIWPDFHDRFVTFLCGLLQPVLRPKYIALTQDRLYVVESERPIQPDVSVVRTSARLTVGATSGLLEVDAPAVFEWWRDEIREPYIKIIEPAAGNRLITAIEVLSPENKVRGPGRKSYLRKRDEFWQGGANLVEIDFLRAGQPTVRISREQLDSLRPWRYLVAVTRRWPSRHEVYAVPLERQLPRVAIPLGDDDRDVPLDLQAAFTRCWDEGPYPELLHYDGPAPGELTEAESQWCRQRLEKAGFTA
jgi:hypothetical protein